MKSSNYWMLALAAGLAGCQTSSGPQMSHLFVRLTDAPAPALASAQVWISTVYLVGSDGTSRFTITTGPSTEYDLLDFQGGVTALLGDNTIPAGDYEQLRLVVDSARVTLAGGALFSDGTDSREMKVPSGPQTGIKVEFGGPVHIAPGQTSLVVDFDVARSFVFLGPGDSPNGVLFKPVLHGTVSDQAGSISGTSSPAAALGMLFAINGLDTVATASADPVTGAYELQFLAPGIYTVADSSTVTGHKAASQSVTVGVAQHVSGVDFALP
jgi:hypothetical protein